MKGLSEVNENYKNEISVILLQLVCEFDDEIVIL
jgi:hypothetical protein